ncbi:Serine/threonine-protein kinase PAK 1 [Aphelenchoides avenae]|nr:Serine/threonine-protein kinase PAK 1 [Aphelenchus avenae]
MLHHTDPDQLKCVSCGRRFGWKRHLLEHEASCGSYFKCDVPGCEFDTEKKHERRVHNGRYTYACDKCGAGFDNGARFRTHTKNSNGVAAAFKARIRQVAENHRIEEDYERTAEIVGQGLSCVFKAKGLKPADIGKQFAVKKIDVKKDTPAESRAATYRALTEARIAKSRCGHENTAGVEAAYYQDSAVYTVAKLVVPGNLLKAVTKLFLKGRLFEEAQVASIKKDILSGLGHIHGQGLLHRDMKTANVLLGVNGACMIVDFGESAIGGPQRGTGVGTDGYRPSEAWGDEKQTKTLDVYPLGIIAAECMAMRGAPER